MFQEDLSLFPTSCEKILGISLPDPEEITIVNPDLTEISPVERRADTVLQLRFPGGSGYVATGPSSPSASGIRKRRA